MAEVQRKAVVSEKSTKSAAKTNVKSSPKLEPDIDLEEDVEVESQSSSQEDDDEQFLRNLAQQVNTALKQDNIMVGEEAGGDEGVPYWILTGIPQLDFAIGGHCHPGIPGARIIEIYGDEAVGKSTLSLHIVKRAIEQVKAVAYYQDVERVLTPEIIKGTQIDMKRVMRDQPETLEDVFDSQEVLMEKLIGVERPVVTVVDSIAACSTLSEIAGDMKDNNVAPHARLMSKGLRKIKAAVTTSKVLSLWVNQSREKVGTVSWGDTTTTFGGKAMRFYASVRIKLSKKATLKKTNAIPYGCTIEAKMVKNKVAPPLRTAQYDILFMEDKYGSYPRIDLEGAILDWCKDYEIITGTTGRYIIDGRSMYKDAARQLLIDHPDIMADLTKKAYEVDFE